MINFWLLFSIYIGAVSVNAERQLVYVQAIWRHGDRAPNKLPYPNDLNTEAAWPRGFSQLTNLGMQQLYDLGKFFRQRYSDFVGSRFDMNKVMVTSTNSERAIVSAQAFLRGFYPAEGKDVWLDGESWQPLPFYSRTFGDNDPKLRPTDYDCSLYDIVTEKQNKKLFKELEKKYKDYFKFLKNVTGFEKVNLDKAASINNVQREVIHGLPQPDWVYKRWPEYENQTTLEIAVELKRITKISEFNSPEKALLRGGLLVGDWIARAINVSQNITIEPSKMMLYSTHDGTVSSLMYDLNIGDNLMVPYAACVIMEVYRTSSGDTEVKFFYRNETKTETLQTRVVPGCDEYCPVKKLVTLLAKRVLRNENELEKACCFGIKTGVCAYRNGDSSSSSSSSSSEEKKKEKSWKHKEDWMSLF